MPKKMTRAEIIVLAQEARKEKKESRISFIFDKYKIESYEYGWTYHSIGNSLNKFFFVSMENLLRSMLEDKLKRSSAKNINELLEEVTNLKELLTIEVEKIVKKLNKEENKK